MNVNQDLVQGPQNHVLTIVDARQWSNPYPQNSQKMDICHHFVVCVRIQEQLLNPLGAPPPRGACSRSLPSVWHFLINIIVLPCVPAHLIAG